MDTLELPVLKPNDSVQTAIDEMDRYHCSGVLVDYGNRVVLAFVSGIRKAEREGAATLADVDDTIELSRPDSPTVHRFALDLVAPHSTSEGWRDYFDSADLPYSIAKRSNDRATVVTRHEGLAQMLRDTYYCNGPVVHYFPEPSVSVGEECPECIGQPKGTISQK